MKEKTKTPFRPSLPQLELDVEPQIVQLMKNCWQENPEERPDMVGVMRQLMAMTKGKYVSLM